jgi:hypothetical protein
MESVSDWLNENELRAYPLIEGEYGNNLPDNFLLDLILKVETNEIAQVKLLNVQKLSTTMLVTFTGAGNTFELDLIDDLIFPHYRRNPNGSLAVFGEGVLTLAALLNDGDVLSLNLTPEPATIYDFTGPWLGVSRIKLAEGFKSEEDLFTAKLPLEVENDFLNLSLTGEVVFTPGFNYGINFNGDLINMEASFGLGDQVSCVTEFVSPELKDCADIISFINGVPPDDNGIFRFIPGTNISVFEGTTVKTQLNDTNATPDILNINANTLFVGLTFLETDLCSPVQLLPTNN